MSDMSDVREFAQSIIAWGAPCGNFDSELELLDVVVAMLAVGNILLMAADDADEVNAAAESVGAGFAMPIIEGRDALALAERELAARRWEQAQREAEEHAHLAAEERRERWLHDAFDRQGDR